MNAIHIAGTKGKGSTSAFISSILGQYLAPDGPQSNGSTTPSSGSRPQLRKIGLYTSPHLRSVRERIQLNNEALSESEFARYFFEIWDRLDESAAKLGLSSATVTPTSTFFTSNMSLQEDKERASAPIIPTKPVYFRYLTLMAFHAYLKEKVDTAIIECGIGGEYDSTNIIEQPSVTAVTSLGIDHTAVLGESIEEIAWHKAGIFKANSKVKQVFTVFSQPPSAMKVLQERASAAGLELCAVPCHPDIASGKVPLGLAADFQKTNASLAVAVAAAHLRSIGMPGIPEPLSQEPLTAEFVRGLQMVRWGGRCEVRRQGNIVWHIDGGHTMESIRLAAQWFGSCVLGEAKQKEAKNKEEGQVRKQKRILLFNQQTRDAPALAKALHQALEESLASVARVTEKEARQSDDQERPPLFTHALFSTNITYAASPISSPTLAPADAKAAGSSTKGAGRYKPDLMSMNTSSSDIFKLTVQTELAEVWSRFDSKTEVQVTASIEEAIEAVRAISGSSSGGSDEVMVLVTGSLHLVGGVLEVLDTK